MLIEIFILMFILFFIKIFILLFIHPNVCLIIHYYSKCSSSSSGFDGWIENENLPSG